MKTRLTPAPPSIPAGATTPQLREIAKAWAKSHHDLPAQQVQLVITGLIHHPSAIKKTLGGILLGYLHSQRRQLSPVLYEDWLEHTEGWAAVDAICYNNFSAAEILDNFSQWKTVITRLSKSDNLNKCRGAIVLLTKPVRQSADRRLMDLSFQLIDRLRAEKSILISKAVSWLLRQLTEHHSAAVAEYLRTHKNNLPAIVFRETSHKLHYGIKSPKKNKS
jgi:3-methyladenine DNA glycosylase AlkD